MDTRTGVVLLQFAYDSAGHLTGMTDESGNVTTIVRADDGAPQAIVGPFGQRTALTLDAGGYLAAARMPGGETTQFTSDALGLMQTRQFSSHWH